MFFGIITVFTCVSIALNWVDTMNPTDEAMLIQHPVLQHPKLKKLGKKLKRLGAKVNELRAKNIAEAKGLGKKVHAARKNNVDSNSDKAVVESNVNANAAAIDGKPEIDTEEKMDTADSGEHTIGGLKCAAYGGPPDEIAAKEMVYWSDISSDAEYIPLTSVPSGKTVSRWASSTIVLLPINPSLKPITLPAGSIHTLSAPAFSSIALNTMALSPSIKGGAGISVKVIRFSIVCLSICSITANASAISIFLATCST